MADRFRLTLAQLNPTVGAIAANDILHTGQQGDRAMVAQA